MDQSILPYSYPTTLLCVDDEENFLESMRLRLSSDFSTRLFSIPMLALDYINGRATTKSLDQRCMSYFNQKKNGNPNHLIKIDMALLEQEINKANRFSEISVVIVDYRMPGMDGLKFCENIEDKRIKKILLTGIGDDQLAVDAFNKGIIDKFIKKNDENVVDLIVNSVRELQYEYLSKVTNILQSMISLNAPEYLKEETFQSYFLDLIDQEKFVEYYYVENPNGFLLLKGNGKLSRLLIYTDRQLDMEVDKVSQLGASDSQLEALRSREFLPFFCDEEIDLDDDAWNEYLAKTVKVMPLNDQNASKYYCAIYENPPADIDFEKEVSNYGRYLKSLDSLLVNEVAELGL